jgi:GR25 family glycosyltransferase involved in LPS biosynthesis
MFTATTPASIKEHIYEVFGENSSVKWNWPIDPNQDGYNIETSLYKKHYPARDQQRVIACALSHIRLWKKCVDLNQEIIILEHDSIFIRQFDLNDLGEDWGVVGLNDPRGATRKSAVFYKHMLNLGMGVHKVPSVDSAKDIHLPEGLAGNSAYIIKPSAAKDLLVAIKRLGLWPNDALMCKQLFPWLRVVYPFYTRIQGVESTTTR